MNGLRSTFLVSSGLGLALLSGCGGSASMGSGDNPMTGSLNVHLVDGPIGGYQEINLHILRVEISTRSGWLTLGSPDRTFDLLRLVGGVEEMLASGASLPAGHYDQMRLILGTGNTVKLPDGTVQPLTVPSGLQTGIKLIVSLDVAAGTTKDVFIDFQAAHSIQINAAGASGTYLLRPTVMAFDKAVTGSITGSLSDQATAAPLAGVLVYAETLDGSGRPTVARSTLSSATGAYTLDLLPLGATYYVVCLPLTGTSPVTAYGPQASDGMALSVATPTFTFQGAFTVATLVNGLNGTVTPPAAANQSDTVDLQALLPTPSNGTHTFSLASTVPIVGSTGETFAFPRLPAGNYALEGIRTTLASDGTSSSVRLAPQPVNVPATGAATANLAF